MYALLREYREHNFDELLSDKESRASIAEVNIHRAHKLRSNIWR